MVGTMGKFTSDEISVYLKRVIVSRFNDYLGKELDSILNLPGRFDELSEELMKKLMDDFSSALPIIRQIDLVGLR